MIIIVFIIAYLLGSIPFGLLISRLKGVDIRAYGSGNIGATNVLRIVGKKEAVITLIADMLKGATAVIIARAAGVDNAWVASAGICSIIGHNYSVFLGFKGGKGVATSFGVLSAYLPIVAAISVAIWIITVILWRYSSLGAIVSFLCLPLLVTVFNYSLINLIFSLAISLMIIYRHRENIKRLIDGTEGKIGKKVYVDK
ncbi:MAG: glycerol-3-phosphate 1-O-acyltransferase PlsY [Nitrospirota bacterium]